MKKSPREAWLPPDYELADAYALQALSRGEADAAMQQRALKWVIEKACGTYEHVFRPEALEMAYAEGRRSVGLAIVKLLRLNTAALTRERTHPPS